MAWNVILTGNASVAGQHNMLLSEVLLALHQEITASFCFPVPSSEFCLTVNHLGKL
jgi:hypothetical protein